ncbi:uncharacterized protein LOC123545546 [Mercenaria mercenaria]|uniref:uncharacterized protein LOC123545546 n=1 Tax=Mercenaria mercenaria TaxID=6596 RepID=UPI00234E745F|nr:uncharacterized protein LOC123545546 [Mercenaria mercenaria]
MFLKSPSLPRCKNTWDVERVLKFISDLGNNENLEFTTLTYKLVILLGLTTGQRCQTLSFVDVRNIEFINDGVKIRIGDMLKQSSANRHLKEIFLKQFKQNEKLCVVECLRHYLIVTSSLRQSTQLFVALKKPHNPVTKSTIARWIKTLLKFAGIDMTIFKPHSVRAAACSAVEGHIPIDTILKTAGWTRKSNFRKFYDRPVKCNDEFGHTLLSKLKEK